MRRALFSNSELVQPLALQAMFTPFNRVSSQSKPSWRIGNSSTIIYEPQSTFLIKPPQFDKIAMADYFYLLSMQAWHTAKLRSLGIANNPETCNIRKTPLGSHGHFHLFCLDGISCIFRLSGVISNEEFQNIEGDISAHSYLPFLTIFYLWIQVCLPCLKKFIADKAWQCRRSAVLVDYYSQLSFCRARSQIKRRRKTKMRAIQWTNFSLQTDFHRIYFSLF